MPDTDNTQQTLFPNNAHPIQYMTIQDGVNQMKTLINNAILGGLKINAIRSQEPINCLHNAVKAELITRGVNPRLIKPSYNTTKPEMRLSGFCKSKNQDVCVLPNDRLASPETLNFAGILNGKNDPYGFSLTESILSINVRSQLSSISKNFDTLYERTFAESLNLHLRCPNMVLGELYLIPVYEYDEKAAENNEIAFKPNQNISKHIEKYILSFSAISNRESSVGNEYKYERTCLLIVDFNHETPIIYNTTEQLIDAGLLPHNTTVNINNMNFPTFIANLLSIHETRFGANKFT